MNSATNKGAAPQPAQTPERRQRWLVISHAFNMDGRAASLTVTDKLPFLAKAGIELVILSGVLGSRDTTHEHHQLLPWGPAGLRFDLRHALARRIGRGLVYRLAILSASLLLLPFIVLERVLTGLRHQWSWALPAWFRARSLIRRTDVRLVYTSGGAYSAHLAGLWTKLSTGCTWIAEIHDPIVIPGRPPPTRDARFQARLEGWMCRHADLVWWFTDGALGAARARHPALADKGFMVLPGANPPVTRVDYAPGQQCVFGHFGSLAETRSLAPAIEALHRLRTERPEVDGLVSLEVYGSQLDPLAKSRLSDLKMAEHVRLFGRLEVDPSTGMSGRERVLCRMQQVDWLLMMHGQVAECAEYIPSKLYDYFWARRPVLAITWQNPQLDAMVIAHGGRVAPTDDVAAIAAAFSAAFDQWRDGSLPLSIDQPPPVSVEGAVKAIIDRVDALDPACR